MAQLDKLMFAAVEDAAKLLVLGPDGDGFKDAAARLGALQEISRGLRTETLLMLAQVCAQSHAAGKLQVELQSYLAGDVRWLDSHAREMHSRAS